MHIESVRSYGFCHVVSIQGIIIDTEIESHGGCVRGCHLMPFQSQCPLLNDCESQWEADDLSGGRIWAQD